MELALAVAGLAAKPPVELGDGVLLIEHELPEVPRIVLISDRNSPHMRQALEREVLRSGERELESPWARADREARAQRERVLDQIAMEKALRPMPLPRPPKTPPLFREYRVVDSEEKRERRKSNKAARQARKRSKGRR